MEKNNSDKLFDIILDIRDQTIKNTIVLEEHARRSLASEARLEIQEEKLDKFIEHLDSRIQPVETHIKLIHLLMKILAAAVPIAGTIIGIYYSIKSHL